jgi:pyruvate formate lyase activating enzyme
MSGLPETGLIFNVQRFSVHDGPGIRTTVFMKGCPLRCQWCSNPESWDSTPHLMVRDAECTTCGACERVCPRHAIVGGSHRRGIVWEKCDHCLRCVSACAYGSLRTCGRTVTVDETVSEVLRDRPFYRNSAGGVTVSGGEPLLQPEFVRALLARCKAEGLHTALDTSACVSWDVMARVLECVDLVLFDLKHPDSGMHRLATGAANEGILQNLARTSRCTRVWLRVPLMAGFNDSSDVVERLAALACANGVEKISLLPYHQGGESKCTQLGRPYLGSAYAPPTDDRVSEIRRRLESHKLVVSVGS